MKFLFGYTMKLLFGGGVYLGEFFQVGEGNEEIFGCWGENMSSGVFLGCTKILFKEENFVLLFLYVLHCRIHEGKFLHTFRILEIDQFFSFLLFSKIILTLHIDFLR